MPIGEMGSKPEEERLNEEDALIAAEAEKPLRDAAREPGVTQEAKDIMDKLAEKLGAKAVEGYKNKGFFGITEEEFLDKIERASVDPKNGKPHIVLDTIKRGTKKEWDRRLDTSFSKGKVPDSFFENATELVKEYKEIKPTVSSAQDTPSGVFRFEQLRTIIKHPGFIKDPRCVAVIEELTGLDPKAFSPLQWVGFTAPNFETGKDPLRDGFGVEHVPTFQKIVDSLKIWESKNKEGSKWFLDNVSIAVRKIAEDHPSETLPLRLSILRRDLEANEGNDEIRHHMYYTFKSDEDMAALKKIVVEEPESKIAGTAEWILSGGHKIPSLR